MKAKNNYINDDLLVKYLLGETSEEEIKNIDQWLAENEDNRIYFEQFKKIWTESRKLGKETDVDEEAAWLRFRSRLNEPVTTAVVLKNNSFGWLRIAALFLIIAGAALLYYVLKDDQKTNNITAQAGNRVLKDTLPDGSVITLNKNASLVYPEKFKGDTRSVSLSGEAFFEISPNKEKPFLISVNEVIVKVVGTSFNIRSSQGATEVIVETGIVQVIRDHKTVELRPGQKLLVNSKDTSLNIEKAEDHLYNYYRSREFVCDQTALWKLVEVLNEAYGVQIVIEKDSLKNLPLTATFSNESLDTILSIISQTFSITVERSGNKIILK